MDLHTLYMGLVLFQLFSAIHVTCAMLNRLENTQESGNTQITRVLKTTNINTTWSAQALRPIQPMRIRQRPRKKQIQRISPGNTPTQRINLFENNGGRLGVVHFMCSFYPFAQHTNWQIRMGRLKNMDRAYKMPNLFFLVYWGWKGQMQGYLVQPCENMINLLGLVMLRSCFPGLLF